MADLNGAEAIALLLREAGVRDVFGYVGTSELALAGALSERIPGYRNARGDKEAVFLAAGAGCLRTDPAAALLHGARGLTNAAGALGDVWRNEIGVVCLVGLPSTGSQRFLPPHGEPRLLETVGRFCKAWYEIPAVPADPVDIPAAAEALVRMVRAAVGAARARPRGPVLLGLPQDVMEARWVPRSTLDLAAPDRPEAPIDGLADAIRILDGADRPVVLVDDYLLKDERGIGALRAFTDRLGAPALQVRYRRGPMLFQRVSADEVPAFAGWYDPADADHVELLRAADVIVTIEDRNMYPRVIGELPACTKVAFSCAPDRTGKNGYLTAGDVMVAGDTCANLATVTAALRRPPRRHPVAKPVTPETRSELWPIVSALSAALAEQERPVIVDDSQMFGGLLAQAYDLLPGHVRILGDHGGFVGGGLATAVGTALGNPDLDVTCTLGDQGFTNGLQGLVAAVEHAAPVTFVVCNNGGSVSLIKQVASLSGTARPVTDHLGNVPRLDYAGLAAALDMPAHRLTWGDGAAGTDGARLCRLLREHRRHAGPSLVELVLPSRPQAWAGIWSVEGLERQTAGAVA